MGTGATVSIIILAHNKVGMTRRCLEALAVAAAPLDHEVILLDNHSSEDITPLEEAGGLFKAWHLIRSGENLSFSRANNRCAAHASGRYLLFLNNDVFLQPGSVASLVRHLDADGSAGIAGGMLLFPGGEAVQHAGMHQMLWGFASNYGAGALPDDERVRQACERFALTGAMLCLGSDLFRGVGGFDERYVWGYEDVDLCLKVRAAGLGVRYLPQAAGIHVESATQKETRNQDYPGNYRTYRETWDGLLVPRERDYIRWLKREKVRRVAVFGTGMAARGLAAILGEHGIRIEAFTSSRAAGGDETFLGRPVVPLAALPERKFDRLIVATQFYFAVESLIRDLDPLQAPIYPVLA